MQGKRYQLYLLSNKHFKFGEGNGLRYKLLLGIIYLKDYASFMKLKCWGIGNLWFVLIF